MAMGSNSAYKHGSLGRLCDFSIGIGLYFALTGGKQKTTDEFLLGDRKLKVIPTTISLLVSYQSAIMILGGTAEMYVGGTMAWIWYQFHFFAALIFVAQFIIPWLYPLKLTSIYRIFEMRYRTQDVRIFSAVLGVICMVLYMGTAMYAPSVALEAATGFPAKLSIPIMAVVCIIYTSLGGMKAVIWTDVFQFCIMIAGMLCVMIKGLVVVGGFRSAFDLLGTEGRLTFADFNPDPTVRHTFWGFTIGSTVAWIKIYGLNQASVQRFCSIGSMRGAKMSIYLNLPPLLVMSCLTALTGVSVVAYFIRFKCDPILSNDARFSNELLPIFVKRVFQNTPGFSGLFLATLYSGALSSVSSSLSSSAAITWDDMLQKSLPNISQYHASVINKVIVIIDVYSGCAVLHDGCGVPAGNIYSFRAPGFTFICRVVIYGLIAIGISFMIAEMKGPIGQISMSVGSAVAGPLVGIFILSCIRQLSWCRSKPVLLGAILGLAFNMWMIGGSRFVKGKAPPLPPFSISNCTAPHLANYTLPVYTPLTGLDRFYTVSYMWYTMFGAMVTVICGMALSFVFNKMKGGYVYEAQIPENVFIRFRSARKPDTSEYDSTDSDIKKVELTSYKDSN